MYALIMSALEGLENSKRDVRCEVRYCSEITKKNLSDCFLGCRLVALDINDEYLKRLFV